MIAKKKKTKHYWGDEDKRKTCWRCGKKVNPVMFTGRPEFHASHKNCKK